MAAFAKPLLYAGTVDLVECSIGIQNLFLFFFEGGKFKNKNMKVINEDCMYGLDQMAENSIDLLITDPPYSTPVITAFGRKKFKNLADLSIQEFYFTEMKKKLERTLKPDAPVFFFCDDKFYPILFSAFYDWQNIGLIIWDKNKIGMGKPVRKRHELIFYANQTFRDFKPHGQFTHLPSVLNFKHDSEKIHGAQKPVALIEMLINGFTNEGDTVVDLFGGSGSTGIASDSTKRNGICFELNSDISTASKERGEKRKEKDLHAETLFGNEM